MQFKNLLAALAMVSYAVAAPAAVPEPVQKRQCEHELCCAMVVPGFLFIQEIGYNCIAVPPAGCEGAHPATFCCSATSIKSGTNQVCLA